MRKTRTGILALAASGALAAGLTACGDTGNDTKTIDSGSSSDAAPAPTQTAASAGAAEKDIKVQIVQFKFKAPDVTVAKGGTIAWTNQDTAPHTATASDDAQKAMFDTGTLKKGQTKSITFKTAGTYKYLCVFHPFMTGTVTVQ